MYNFYFKHQDFAVLAIPRCGSESLADGQHLTPRDVALNYARVLCFLRAPLERCISGFQFFHQWPNDFRYAATYEAWVNRMLDLPPGPNYANQARLPSGRIISEPQFIPRDPHWLPQSVMINEAIVPPNEIWKFEAINTVIPGLRHYHTSPPLVFDTTYRLTELRAYYADDLALRLTALG